MSDKAPKFDDPNSLVTAIVQDASSGKVLMLAHMNQAAWDETIATGYAVFFSRGRQKLWRKGETSGHVQKVREIYVDCDGDALLLKVEQTGAACHEGYESCFFRRLDEGQWQIVGERLVDPATIYPSQRMRAPSQSKPIPEAPE